MWSLAILGVALLVLFTLSRHDNYREENPIANLPQVNIIASEQASTTEIIASLQQEKVGLPIEIKIPSINVEANFVSVGLTPDGAMDIPKGPTEVAWYNLGHRPGDIGSAVIAGHFGWKDGIPAVFDHLDKLQKGDKLYIENEYGTTTTFIVRGSRTYGENEDASEVFVANDGLAHLNLVTCQGVWNKHRKSYSKRLVVFTDKVVE